MNITWIVEKNSPAIASVRLRVRGIARELARGGVTTHVITSREAAPDSDVYVFCKAYSNRALSLAGSLAETGGRILFDLCDNRFIYKDPRLQQMLALADAVSCPTATLQQEIEQHTSAAVTVIPDCMEPATAAPQKPPLTYRFNQLRCTLAAGDRLRLVWFGSAGSPGVATGLQELALVVPALNTLYRTRQFHLTVISNSFLRYQATVARARFPSTYVAWSQRDFSEHLRSAELAVLPVSDTPYNRTKSENRLLTCIEHALPAVVGALPSYQQFAPHVFIGDIAQGIEQYAQDPQQSRADIARAQAYAQAHFSPAVIASGWRNLLQALASRR